MNDTIQARIDLYKENRLRLEKDIYAIDSVLQELTMLINPETPTGEVAVSEDTSAPQPETEVPAAESETFQTPTDTTAVMGHEDAEYPMETAKSIDAAAAEQAAIRDGEELPKEVTDPVVVKAY